MAKVQFDRIGFKIDGEDQFFVSGEFHYFRVPAYDWKRRMELFKEAGGNCLATYVPWLIHEPEEGKIVWDDVPNRDLVRFLETAKEVGLKVLLRPGPYQYSELINGGLPDWLLDNYPEILARNIHGEPFVADGVSYLHPTFLEKARTYFRAFADVVRPYMGDPVVMLQVDNEVAGIHVWSGSIDYHPVTMGIGTENGRYPAFLKRKYGTLDAVNEAYRLSAAAWSEIKPAEMGERNDVAICRRLRDYLDFYYGTLGEYLALLTFWLREDGLTGPICHNSANPSMNSNFLETLAVMGEDFLLGSDHYYTLDQNWPQNNPTPQYAVNIYYSMEMLRLMGMPPTVMELPGGSPTDTPPILPEDLLCCYMTNLAMGMKGMNYYVYTGGPNFPNTCSVGDIYDYNAHIRADGSFNPTYESLKAFGKFMEGHSWMQRANRRGSAVIGFEWAATRCRDTEYKNAAFTRTDCWDFARRGLVHTMMCSEFAPELKNLDGELDLTRPLVVPTPTVMSKAAQQNIIDFVEAGGQVLLVGTLPELDDEYRPCTLLREYLGNPELRKPRGRSCVVHSEEAGNVYCMSAVHGMDLVPDGAEVLCTEVHSGDILGFTQEHGKGRVMYLATRWLMKTFDQAEFMELLLGKLGAKPSVKSSNRNIFTSLMEDEQGRGVTIVMNLYSSPQSTDVTVYNKDGSVNRTEHVSMKPMEVVTIE